MKYRSIRYIDEGDFIRVFISRSTKTREYKLSPDSLSIHRLGRVVKTWMNKGLARPTYDSFRKELLIENLEYSL